MREAVVEIVEESTGRLAARLFRCRDGNQPIDRQDAMKLFPLLLDPATLPPLDTSANVANYGTQIRAALAGHPAIGAELNEIFQTNARSMLRFWIGPLSGESYRWETVCEPPRFLALRDLCTISRLARLDGNGSDTRSFKDTLRMAAFLSPAGISAKAEFDSLVAQVRAARAGLNIQCTVYVGEQDLLDHAPADIEVEPIPYNTIALDQLLRQRPVELLHFFCHGVSLPVQGLELATISDWEAGELSGSVMLSLERLDEILDKTCATWITVLNSCCGAKGVEKLHSMALMLAKRGSPITVGMAEPITGSDATIFSGAFYEALFGLLKAQLGGRAPGNSVTLDLAPAIINARRIVHTEYQRASDAYGRWAVPLLYERGDPLVVQVVDDAMKLRINTIAGLLRNLPAVTPDGMREDILKLLDKEPRVPDALRPDRFGVVPS
jgi:CHAT domain